MRPENFGKRRWIYVCLSLPQSGVNRCNNCTDILWPVIPLSNDFPSVFTTIRKVFGCSILCTLAHESASTDPSVFFARSCIVREMKMTIIQDIAVFSLPTLHSCQNYLRQSIDCIVTRLSHIPVSY